MLVVGGGEIALRKVRLLARAGARLAVVAPRILPETAAAAEESGGEVLRREYAAADVCGCAAAVSATDNDGLNRRVCADARAAGVPVNVVDNPALCDFIFPAVVDRGAVVAAVSSGGASPVLARRLRAKIEEMLPPFLGRLGDFCAKFRGRVQGALPAERRRLFWEKIIDGAAAEAALSGDNAGAEALLEEELRRFSADKNGRGEVYLIGAGPGAADLLTFRAHRFLQKADVVVYDRLVSAEVLELSRRDAERIFVGKRRGSHAASQEEINRLLVSRARDGLRVARLKGGDPFIFGRGGEEMLALRAAGVSFHIAPGITAACGVAAAAGIPLTHRGVAGAARFCAARRGDMEDAEYWRRLAEDGDCTLLFYMSGESLGRIAENLAAAGRAPETAAAVVCAGTLAGQKVITGDLSNIAARAESFIVSPALLIVGDAAALHAPEYSWREEEERVCAVA